MAGVVREIKLIWHYRRFIVGSVLREFKSRFNRSLLGAIWLLLAPFAMILIYTLIFAHVMQAKIPGAVHPYSYSIFICAGLLPWQWFAELVTRNASLFLDNASLIKKNSFPRMALPVINLFSSGVNFILAWGIFCGFLIVTSAWPGWVVLLMLPLLALQALFASALGFFLGVVNVFFRDVGNAVALLFQFWFWLTPIVYSFKNLPAWLVPYLQMNPMTPLVSAYHSIMVDGVQPDWQALRGLVLLCFVFLALSVWIYRRAGGQIVDEI